jgi:hypothetical protein
VGVIIDSNPPNTDSKPAAVHTLKLYIEGYQGRWEAICVDYDIAVQAHTLDAVIESMKTAISMYLERAHELSPKERAALLRRRAPWSVRFGFVARAIASSLMRPDRSNGKTTAEFLIPCPA